LKSRKTSKRILNNVISDNNGMKKTQSIILFLLLLVLSSAQAQDNSYDQSVKVKINEPFELKFEACQDCGFHWFLEPFDTNEIKLVSVSSKSTSGKTNIFGGNVFETWKFIGLQKGIFWLNFYYKRPWLDEINQTKKTRIEIE
jgi:predicted secreted protein